MLIKIMDLFIFVIANLTNLLLAAMFLFRARGRSKTGNAFGWGRGRVGDPASCSSGDKSSGRASLVDLRPAGNAGFIRRR